jgi:hypothetical protein
VILFSFEKYSHSGKADFFKIISLVKLRVFLPLKGRIRVVNWSEITPILHVSDEAFYVSLKNIFGDR